MRWTVKYAGLVAVFALAVVPACNDNPPAKDASSVEGDGATEGTDAPAETTEGASGSADSAFKHGSQKGPGSGGGEKGSKGAKEGAGGFKHGSKKGPGEGGGKKEAVGPKTAGKGDGAHGKGKGDGSGGGEKDGKGDQAGVMKK